MIYARDGFPRLVQLHMINFHALNKFNSGIELQGWPHTHSNCKIYRQKNSFKKNTVLIGGCTKLLYSLVFLCKSKASHPCALSDHMSWASRYKIACSQARAPHTASAARRLLVLIKIFRRNQFAWALIFICGQICKCSQQERGWTTCSKRDTRYI